MAFRYRQLYPDTDDVLDPRDWNLNMKELAEEFNGKLDRDNLPEAAITTSMVVENAFVKIRSDATDDLAGTRVALDVSTISWQDDDGTDTIAEISFFAPQDCGLLCEFSANFYVTDIWHDDFVRFRIVVDGEVVGMNGPQSLLFAQMSLYVSGAIPVTAGYHTVKAQAQTGAQESDSQGYIKATTVTAIDVGARELVVIERRR